MTKEKFYVNEEGHFVRDLFICVYSFYNGKFDLHFTCDGKNKRDTRKQFREKYKSLVENKQIVWRDLYPYKSEPDKITLEDFNKVFFKGLLN